jgi:hypothetical protein
VVVQAGPAQHGYDIVRRRAQHSFRMPFNATDGSEPFKPIDAPQKYWISCPYRELQAMTIRFCGEAFFAGKTATVGGFKPAVRDFDDDGSLDDVDADPSDPNKK